jgi:hypothetical protein
MKVKQSFQPRRIYLMLRNAMVLNRSSIVVVSASVVGVAILISFLDALGACRLLLHRNLYLVVLIFGGLLFTSRSFRGLHDPIQGLSWLLLPASLLEKTIVHILLTTIIYVTGSMLLFVVISMVSEALNQMLLGRHHGLFSPIDPLVLKSALTYTAIQAPFLVGAVYFRKHALSKTILVLLGFSVLLAMGIFAALRIIFGDQWPGMDLELMLNGDNLGMAWEQLAQLGRTAAAAAKVLLWGVIPVVSWTICYFRLKETER